MFDSSEDDYKCVCVYVCVKEGVYTIVGDLNLHCFSTSTENLEQAMQVSGWGCSLGDMCTHMLTCTSMHKVHLSLLSYSPTGLQIVLILSHSLPTPTPQYTYTQFILLYSIPPVCYMHTNYVVYIYLM